jgi:hypothetical protein
MDKKFFSTLSVSTPLAVPEALNFTLQTWPPNDNFPIVIDDVGNVVSYFKDSVWDLTPWTQKVLRLNFGDSICRKNNPGISVENSKLFRLIMAWWLYRPGKALRIRTHINNYEVLRQIFIFCSKNNVKASELTRFPKILERLSEAIRPSRANIALSLLHEIFENRNELGFYLLDSNALRALSNCMPKHEKSQTAYIPPRIWLYQVNRLRACLDDFIEHKEKIANCFMFCLHAYSKNAGSLSEACSKTLPRKLLPFSTNVYNSLREGIDFYGKFEKALEYFGITELFNRWLGAKRAASIGGFSTYFNLISYVGTAYIMNFSLMRVEEAFSLRSDCLITEKDEVTGENIYILKGVTTKTIEDDDACWITSPSTKIAIDVLSTVARLRMIAAEANKNILTNREDLDNPFLMLRPYEPWRQRSDYISQPLSVRPVVQAYSTISSRFPKLFDSKQMTITKEDLEIGILITPTLDSKEFSVGKVWPIAWHQLRRTGAVNMNASGLVSDSSVQYQLKHATRALARYYGQGYYHLKINLNNRARSEYVRTMYEIIATEFSALQSDRFISPHGERRKLQILSIGVKDHEALTQAAASGKVSYRDTLLGGCTNPKPCPYGGIDHVARCGGGDGRPPCEDALFDKSKLSLIRKLDDVITSRLVNAPKGTPLQQSLQAQKRAVENAIYVLELQ